MGKLLSKDFLSGVMFIAFGLIALYFGQKLALGTPVRMGPGYVPRMLSFILIGLGLVICIVAVATSPEPTEKPRWKPIGLVTLGVVCFGLLFERAGLLPAMIALIFIASNAGEEFDLKEVIGNMVALAILCTLVFKVGLGMNISIVKGIW
ncbi:MAG: tripartite tricarboxylate transporter TctB family protein [Alphaproteobacteria bacterium]|nr:tripartite tricarboxylate transporter TctB family protein [Alphaproteobacteria bacterium]